MVLVNVIDICENAGIIYNCKYNITVHNINQEPIIFFNSADLCHPDLVRILWF